MSEPAPIGADFDGDAPDFLGQENRPKVSKDCHSLGACELAGCPAPTLPCPVLAPCLPITDGHA